MAFLNGLWVEKPHVKAPSFVIAKISINVEKMLSTLKDSKEKYINLQLKESKEGTFYAEIDEWKKESKETPPEKHNHFPEPENDNDPLPF